jgi:hypothetical protein
LKLNLVSTFVSFKGCLYIVDLVSNWKTKTWLAILVHVFLKLKIFSSLIVIRSFKNNCIIFLQLLKPLTLGDYQAWINPWTK